MIKTQLTIHWLFAIGLLFFCGCKKDSDAPDFVKSERQIYEFFLQGTRGFFCNSPTIVDNNIYIGTSRAKNQYNTNGNSFLKLSNSLGKIWEYQLGDFEVKGAATLDEFGNIYFVAGICFLSSTPDDWYTRLYSLDNNGNLRWKVVIDSFNSPESMSLNGGINSPAISTDNTIYVGGDDFYAFDINGNLVWKYDVPDYPGGNQHCSTSPIIDPAGNIYFVASKRELISLDKNGNERWHALTDINLYQGWLSSPAFSVDYSKVFLATYNEVNCINSTSGSLIWNYAIPGMSGKFVGTPAIDELNNIYIGTHGEYNDDTRQTLYAIKADGTGLLWQNNIGSDMYSSPALGNDGTVYIGCENFASRDGYKRLHALDITTGEKKWTASFNCSVAWSSAAISNDGVLYIGTMGMDEDRPGGLYGFQTNSTGLLTNCGSPRYHESNASTGRRQ